MKNSIFIMKIDEHININIEYKGNLDIFQIQSKIGFDRTKMTRQILGIFVNRPKNPKYPKKEPKNRNKDQQTNEI